MTTFLASFTSRWPNCGNLHKNQWSEDPDQWDVGKTTGKFLKYWLDYEGIIHILLVNSTFIWRVFREIFCRALIGVHVLVNVSFNFRKWEILCRFKIYSYFIVLPMLSKAKKTSASIHPYVKVTAGDLFFTLVHIWNKLHAFYIHHLDTIQVEAFT